MRYIAILSAIALAVVLGASVVGATSAALGGLAASLASVGSARP